MDEVTEEMQFVSQVTKPSHEPDPGMLAAVAKLVDGCDELKRWLEASSAKTPTGPETESRPQNEKRLNTSFNQDSCTQLGSTDLPKLSHSDSNNNIDAIIPETQSTPDPVFTTPHHALKSASGSFRYSDPGLQGAQASEQQRLSIGSSLLQDILSEFPILVEFPLNHEHIRKSKEYFLQIFDSPDRVMKLMEITNPELLPEDVSTE
jgi:hypothetical protein